MRLPMQLRRLRPLGSTQLPAACRSVPVRVEVLVRPMLSITVHWHIELLGLP